MLDTYALFTTKYDEFVDLFDQDGVLAIEERQGLAGVLEHLARSLDAETAFIDEQAQAYFNDTDLSFLQTNLVGQLAPFTSAIRFVTDMQTYEHGSLHFFASLVEVITQGKLFHVLEPDDTALRIDVDKFGNKCAHTRGREGLHV